MPASVALVLGIVLGVGAWVMVGHGLPFATGNFLGLGG